MNIVIFYCLSCDGTTDKNIFSNLHYNKSGVVSTRSCSICKAKLYVTSVDKEDKDGKEYSR